jgi:hypothetical protein
MTGMKQKLILSGLFAIAMAFLEATVVVYLRKIYYPAGFSFPLVDIPQFILQVEISREVATIVMLWAIAMLTGSDKRSVFAYFSFNFGVWDIWYYIWLKLLINWPATFMDWDVLFLIPLPWIAPVLAPIIVSVCLIGAAVLILKFENLKLSRVDWLLEIMSALIIVGSFLMQLTRLAAKIPPDNYPWWIFTLGMCLGLGVFYRRLRVAMKEDVH